MLKQSIVTIDWEDWYQGNPNISYLRAREFESRIGQETRHVLKLLKEHKIKATFFLLGHLVEKFPELVRQIDKEGHELASHGFSHRPLYRLKPHELRRELKKTNLAIRGVTNKEVFGFRASNWSVNESNMWVVDVLKEEGFLYDSSIFPAKNYSYGIENAPRYTYQHKNGLWEVPPATIEVLGRRIPCCGGFYLRLWPSWFSQWAQDKINADDQPSVIHTHPWELDLDQPRYLPVPLVVNAIHYLNIGSTEDKLRALFKKNSFITMKKYVEQKRKS